MDRLVTCFFLGFATSAALHFTSAVHFNVQPRNTVTMAGKTVVLRCALDEMLLIGESHHWIWTDYLTGQNVTLSTNRQIEPGLSTNLSRRLSIFGNRMQAEYNLRIYSVSKSEQGSYRCMLHIPQTQEYLYSKPAILTVESISDRVPVCEQTPINMLPGTQVVMSCRAGSRFSTDIAWMLGNMRLRSNLVRKGGYLTAVLRTNIFEQDNYKTFTCLEGSQSVTGVGGGTSECSLTPLIVQTIVTITPSFVTVNDIKDTTIRCLGKSTPSPTFYEWNIDGAMVLNSPGKLLLSDRNRQLIIKALYLQMLNKRQFEITCTVGNSLITSTVKSASIQFKVLLPKEKTTTPPFRRTTNNYIRPTHRINVKLSTENYPFDEGIMNTLQTATIPPMQGNKLPQKLIQDVAIISASVLGIVIVVLVLSIVVISIIKKQKRTRLLELSNYNTVAEQPLNSKQDKRYEIVTPRMKYCHKAGSCKTLQPPTLPDRERYIAKQRRHISEHYNANGKLLGGTPQRKSEFFRRKSSGGSRGEGDGCSIGEEAQRSISLYENAIAIRLSYLNDYSKRYQRASSHHSYDDVKPLAVYNNMSESIYEIS